MLLEDTVHSTPVCVTCCQICYVAVQRKKISKDVKGETDSSGGWMKWFASLSDGPCISWKTRDHLFQTQTKSASVVTVYISFVHLFPVHTHKENNINWNYKTCILREISSMVYQQNNLYTLTALYKYVFYVNLKKNGYCYKILRERNKVVNQKSGLPPSPFPYPSPSNANQMFAPMI